MELAPRARNARFLNGRSPCKARRYLLGVPEEPLG